MRGDVVRFGDPGGPDARRGRASQRAHPSMRKREAQAATTQMGRLGAEDPSRASGRASRSVGGARFRDASPLGGQALTA